LGDWVLWHARYKEVGAKIITLFNYRMSTTQQTKQLKLAQHSAEYFKRAIACKSEFYEAAKRNGYYMTNMKASIITEQRMIDDSLTIH
jgi:hypothetical protein